jgi:hypothetical protein
VDIRHGYFIKNRFATCLLKDVVYQRYACPDPTCPIVGSAQARVVTTSNLLPQSRKLEVSTRMIFHHVDGAPLTDRVGIAMSCAPVNTSGTAACDSPSAQILKSIADWQAQPVETQVFTMTGADPPSPGDSPAIKAERRTQYTAEHHLFAEDGAVTAAPNAVLLRCDVARLRIPGYVGGSDCVFGFTPFFVLRNPDPSIAQSVTFIRSAFADFRDSFPGPAAGHFVPGNAGHPATFTDRTPPVRRMFYDIGARIGHRLTAERSCVEHWGPGYFLGPDGTINACATVPVDATYEGATPPTPGVERGASYAVQPVPAADYLAFVVLTEKFTRENHILDGDSYWLYPFG